MTPRFFCPLVCFLICDFAVAQQPTLQVHEWGTMTAVSGSDGQVLRWYQPLGLVSELPPFVERNMFLSKGPPALIRMETPVLYFYPSESMAVRVEVKFEKGGITEWFPVPAEVTATAQAVWEGMLQPPNHAATLGAQPPIDPKDEAHYGHARQVKNAWLFQASNKRVGHSYQISPDSKLQENMSAVPTGTEQFIFYRGAGDATLPFSVMMPNEESLTVYNQGENSQMTSKMPAFALQVTGHEARWGALATSTDENRSFRFLQPKQPVAQAATDLAVAMTAALTEAGLSSEEAKAMVATWSKDWFTEQGTRVLALLPRPWIDGVLPLKITPTPAKLARVFVGRFEVLSPAREQRLLDLLKLEPSKAFSAQAKSINDELALGRFQAAAAERVSVLAARESIQKYWLLQRFIQSEK